MPAKAVRKLVSICSRHVMHEKLNTRARSSDVHTCEKAAHVMLCEQVNDNRPLVWEDS